MIKVLVVDDSFFMRTLVSNMLSSDPELQVIGTARDGREAIEKTRALKPNVVTMDFLMPGMSGLDTLKRIMKEHPTPTIMLSALTKEGAAITMNCLEAGSVGFVPKPSGTISRDIEKVRQELIEEIKKAAKANVQIVRPILDRKRVKQHIEPSTTGKEKALVIGSSTGGPPALELIMQELPSNFPAAIFIVQHMPPMFTKFLAEHLDQVSEIPVKEAEEGDVATPGKAYVAPGDFHMTVQRKKAQGEKTVVIGLNRNPPVDRLRPSIDVTMRSVAAVYEENTIGVILTGIGKDGTIGMKAIKREGGKTIAQDEATSLIFGMPKKAFEEGTVDQMLSLFNISQGVIQMLQR